MTGRPNLFQIGRPTRASSWSAHSVPARSRSPTLVPAQVRARACGVWRPSFRALTKAHRPMQDCNFGAPRPGLLWRLKRGLGGPSRRRCGSESLAEAMRGQDLRWTLGGSNFRGLGPGGWPPRHRRSPATPPEAPRDLLTHTRARHGARMARARATWAPGRFGPGLDWSGVRQVSAMITVAQTLEVQRRRSRLLSSATLVLCYDHCGGNLRSRPEHAGLLGARATQGKYVDRKIAQPATMVFGPAHPGATCPQSTAGPTFPA